MSGNACYYLYGDTIDLRASSGYVCIDTETTGLEWTDRMLGFSLAWRDNDGSNLRTCYFSKEPGLFEQDIWTEQQILELVKSLFHEKTIFGHYFSFDARVLFREFGITPVWPIDTWHMVKSLKWLPSYSLVSVAASIGIRDPEWAVDKAKRGGLKSLSPIAVAEYARKDAKYTLLVYEAFAPEYTNSRLFDTDVAFGRLTYEMMARGFPLNKTLLDRRIKEETAEFTRLQMSLAEQGIQNVNSPGKVVARLNELGIRAKNATQEELAPYSNQQIVADIIAASQLQSNINSRLLTFKRYEREGRLHAEWHPFGTASFRMVAKDPNLMAQPLKDREGRAYAPLAELFTTDDDYCLQLDIAQAEVRLAAMIARCDSMAVFLASGSDAYMEMAKKAYGEANRENRQKAKRATLASIYEEGPGAFSEKHGVSIDEATSILNQFRASFPEIRTMSRNYAEYAKAHGFINLYTGRRIFFDPNDQRLYRAFNQEVQGGIAELMREYMLRLDRAFPTWTIGQIHDSIILNIHRDIVTRDLIEDIKATSLRILQETLPESVYRLTTPVIPLKLDFEPLRKAVDNEY